MKVMGRIRGLTQRPEALARFFIVAPELASISNSRRTEILSMVNGNIFEEKKCGGGMSRLKLKNWTSSGK